jgi:hypothetical protein
MKTIWMIEYRDGRNWYAFKGWNVTRREARERLRDVVGHGEEPDHRVVKYARVEQ